jgi:hypothetical protein
VVILFIRSFIDGNEIKRIKATLEHMKDNKELKPLNLKSMPEKVSAMTKAPAPFETPAKAAEPDILQTSQTPAMPAVPADSVVKNIPSYTAPPKTVPSVKNGVGYSSILGEDIEIVGEANNRPQTETDDDKGFEKKIGQRIFGILAAMMIFGGLIYLAVQYYEYITDLMKISFIFIASAAVTAFGFLRSKKDKNGFTLAVTACGEGMFVVSILLSRFFFDAWNDTAVFAALGVWFAACLFIARNLKTNTLNFISILDIFIAICFMIGLAEITDLIPIVILQVAISALVLVLSYVMCRKSVAFGLLCSMTASLFSFIVSDDMLTDIPAYASIMNYAGGQAMLITIGLILLLFIITCAVLLCFAVQKLYKENETKRSLTSVLAAIIFGIAFLGIVISITQKAEWGSADRGGLTYECLIPAAGIVFGLLLMVVIEILRKNEKIHPFSANSFVITSGVVILLLNFAFLDMMVVNIPLYIPTALVLIGIYAKSKKPVYAIFSCIMAFIAAFDMMFRYSDLANYLYYRAETQTVYVALALLIFAVIFFIPFLQYKLLSDEHKDGFRMPLQIIFILLSEISLFVLFATPWWFAERYEVLAIIMPLGALAMWYFCTRNDSKLSGFLTFNEYAVLTCCIIILGMSGFPVLSIFIFLSVSALAAYRGKRLLKHEMSTVGQVFFAIKWYAVIIAAMSGFNVENAFIYSLVLMAMGALFIVGGYRFNFKSLRIMGLITAIICTLKIALIDVPASNSALRVVAMIIGGVLCFGISAVYAYFDKRFTIANKE